MIKTDLTEASIEPLLQYFNARIPLSAEEKQLVIQFFQPRLYRRRQYVLQEGDTCNKLNFVVRGCLRMYTIDQKASIHIIQFAAENVWSYSYWFGI